MNPNNAARTAEPPEQAKRSRQVPLRVFVVGAVTVAMALFTWNRTDGDYLLTVLLTGLTGAVMDVRVGEPGGCRR
jgi:L-asparagine transporter-like permease